MFKVDFGTYELRITQLSEIYIALCSILIFPSCILCNLAISLLNLYFCPWTAAASSHQDSTGCCLEYDFKPNCITVFITDKLYRFSKFIMTDYQKDKFKTSQFLNWRFSPSDLNLTKKHVNSSQLQRYNFEEVFSLWTQHFTTEWNLVLILTLINLKKKLPLESCWKGLDRPFLCCFRG